MLTKMVVTAATVFVLNATPEKPKPKFQLSKVEKSLIQKTNAKRAAHDLPPLKMDPKLIRSSRAHVKWMARNDNLTHTNAAVGENIAWNQINASSVVRDWMNSPGHRANILSNGYTRIGVGMARASDGSLYWCQQFLGSDN